MLRLGRYRVVLRPVQRTISTKRSRIQYSQHRRPSVRYMTSRGDLNSQTQNKDTTAPKYCRVCGRLISSSHRNFAERKTCSRACGSTRLNQLDEELEAAFKQSAVELGRIDCGAIERQLQPKDRQNQDDGVTDAQQAGQQAAKWRERVRRAARRVIAFQNDAGGTFECVQGNTVVEPSFAKGEWAVRWTRS